MYDTIKDVINSGRYELNDMLHKIDTLWVQGDLDDDQRDELVELASTMDGNVWSPDAYPAGWQVQE